jgi:para-nitrobenzyl esterase
VVAALPRAFGGAAGVTLPIVLDGHVVPHRPLEAARSGHHNHMPIVMGTNTDEYSTLLAFHAPRKPIATEDDLVDEIRRQLPRRAAAIIARYPASAYPSPRAAYIALWTDVSFTCPVRRALRAFAEGQQEPVYRYVYAHARERGPVRNLGAGHAMEIPFVFHTFLPGGPTDIELGFSDDIVAAWTHFAATGVPGTATSPWPRFRADADPYVRLDVVPGVESGFRSAECDFWDAAAD